MRDELEAILEDEEALEAELAHILSTRVVVYRKNNRQQPEEQGLSGQAVREEGEAFSGRTTETGERWEELPGRSAAAGRSEGITIAGAFPAEESLYVGLAKTRQAAQYRRPAAGQRISLEKEPAGTRAERLDPAWLDQLFRRDARRYDGGFTWQ